MRKSVCVLKQDGFTTRHQCTLLSRHCFRNCFVRANNNMRLIMRALFMACTCSRISIPKTCLGACVCALFRRKYKLLIACNLPCMHTYMNNIGVGQATVKARDRHAAAAFHPIHLESHTPTHACDPYKNVCRSMDPPQSPVAATAPSMLHQPSQVGRRRRPLLEASGGTAAEAFEYSTVGTQCNKQQWPSRPLCSLTLPDVHIHTKIKCGV
jgi:hypothetical protein